MTRATKPFLALVLTAFASLAWAQTETQSTTTPATQESTPSSASSPHQRQTTESMATEAKTASESDPAASSSPHQQDTTTRTRTAEGEGEDQALKECVEQLKEKNKGIPDYTARKACREHVRKQGNTSG